MDAVIATNLVCILFDPAIPTSSINSFNCFYTCFYSFFFCFQGNSSLNAILHGLLIQLQCTLVARCQSSRVRGKSVAMHAPVSRQADKEAVRPSSDDTLLELTDC